MKVKKIKVQIKSLDDALDSFVKIAKKVQSKKNVKTQKDIYLVNVETARAIFTEGRLKIIHIIKSKKPKSIYELAKILQRDFKNVYDDVSFLSELGILGIEENTTGRKQKKPTLICEKILFEIAA